MQREVLGDGMLPLDEKLFATASCIRLSFFEVDS